MWVTGQRMALLTKPIEVGTERIVSELLLRLPYRFSPVPTSRSDCSEAGAGDDPVDTMDSVSCADCVSPAPWCNVPASSPEDAALPERSNEDADGKAVTTILGRLC